MLYKSSFYINLVILLSFVIQLKVTQATKESKMSVNNICLTQEAAISRAKIIVQDSIKYTLEVTTLLGKSFHGVSTVEFKTHNSDPVFLEYTGRKFTIESFNDKQVEKKDDSHEYLRVKGYLWLPKEFLSTPGELNTIRISFENDYYNDGNGVHSYIDVDGKQYIYTQGEAHWANRIFPVFDQPDLKAPCTISVTAHKDWTVISNQPVESKTDAALEGYQTWKFPKTLTLSSYLYTIIAGPFKEIKCTEEKWIYKGITQSIFCRETLYQYALKQQYDIFEFNSDAIRRYEELFGFDYPFLKADSIFCPEYTVGAMENPGAVTYTEHYLYKKEPTRDEITDRASTIIHELAHMWFGDTVTMKWWNDLWLNESFADFVNYIILGDMMGEMSFPIANGWLMFNNRKNWGYRADQLKNTHAIASSVADTDAADSIFDGITYSKGAATMRQLFALIGRDNFSKSMKVYFHKFCFKNATLDDL